MSPLEGELIHARASLMRLVLRIDAADRDGVEVLAAFRKLHFRHVAGRTAPAVVIVNGSEPKFPLSP